jgi:hypothetical protein
MLNDEQEELFKCRWARGISILKFGGERAANKIYLPQRTQKI